MKVESDILIEIHKKVLDKTEIDQLTKLVHEVGRLNLGVGNNQLIRCMLKLSNFNPVIFQEIIDSNFGGDPRDVLVKAQNKFKKMNFGINKFV